MSSSKKSQGNKQIHSYQRAMMSKNATLLKTARPGNPFPASTVPFDPTQPAGPAKFTSAHSSSISSPQTSRTRNAWGVNNKNGSKSESQSRNHTPQHSNGRNNYPQSTVAAMPTRIDQSEFPALASAKPSRPKSAEKPNSPKRNTNASSDRPHRGSSNPSTPQRTFNRKQTQRPRSDTKSKRPQSTSSGEKEDSVWLQYDDNETPKKPAPSNSGNSPQKSLRAHSPNNNTNTKGQAQDSNSNPTNSRNAGSNSNAVSARSGGSNKENDSMAPNPTNSSRFPTNDYSTRNHYHDNRGRGGYHRGGPMQPPPNGAINVDVDSFDRQPGYYERPPMFDNFNGPPPGRRGGGPRGRGRGGHRGRGRGLRGRGGSPQHRGTRNVPRMNPNSDPSMHWTSRKRFVPNGAIPNFTPEFKPYRRPSYKAFLQAIKDREKRFDEQLAQFQRDRKYYAKKHVKDHMDKLREERDRVKEEKLLKRQLQQQRKLQVAMDQQNRSQPTNTTTAAPPHVNTNTAAPQQTPRGPNESRSRHYFTQIGLHPVTPLQQQLINGVNLSPANQPSHPPKLAMPPNLPQNLPPHPSVLGLPALSNPSSTNITTPPLSALSFTNAVNTQNPIQLLHGLSPNPLSMPSGTTTTNTTGNTGGKIQRVASSQGGHAVNVRAPSPGHSLENTQHTGSFKAHHRGKTPGKTLSANSAPWKGGVSTGNWSKVPPSTSSNVQSVESSQPTSNANTTTSSRGASPSVANGNGRETASPYPGPGAASGLNPTTHSASQQSQSQQVTKSSTHTPQAQPTANSQMPSISLSSVPTGQSQKQLQTPKLSLMQSLGSIPQTSAAGPIQFGQSLYTQHQAQARQHQIQHITQQQQHQQQQQVLLQQQAMNQIWNHQHNAQQPTPRAQGQDSYRNVNVQAPPPPPPQWSGVNPQPGAPVAPHQYSQEFRPPISPAANPHQYPAAPGPAQQPGTPYNQWNGPGRGNYPYPPHNPTQHTQWQPQHHQPHWQQPPYY